MIELIRFYKGSAAYYKGLMAISPWLAAMKAGVISKQKGKEKLLTHFFKGMPLEQFDTLCNHFSRQVIPALIRPDAYEAIQEHKAGNDIVAIVSASADNWVAPWCQANGIIPICTKLQVINDKLTGKLEGLNCNGKEKVSRITQLYDPGNFESVFCYGDTGGDKEMLAIATHPSYRVFIK